MQTFALIFLLWLPADESWVLDHGMTEEDCLARAEQMFNMAEAMGGELICEEEQ